MSRGDRKLLALFERGGEEGGGHEVDAGRSETIHECDLK